MLKTRDVCRCRRPHVSRMYGGDPACTYCSLLIVGAAYRARIDREATDFERTPHKRWTPRRDR